MIGNLRTKLLKEPFSRFPPLSTIQSFRQKFRYSTIQSDPLEKMFLTKTSFIKIYFFIEKLLYSMKDVTNLSKTILLQRRHIIRTVALCKN